MQLLPVFRLLRQLFLRVHQPYRLSTSLSSSSFSAYFLCSFSIDFLYSASSCFDGFHVLIEMIRCNIVSLGRLLNNATNSCQCNLPRSLNKSMSYACLNDA